MEDATRLLALVHGANQLAGRRAEQAAAATAAAGGSPGAQEGALWAAGGGEAQGGAGGAAAAAAAAGWRPVEAATFYNQAINHEDFNLKEDLRKWKHVGGGAGGPGGGRGALGGCPTACSRLLCLVSVTPVATG